MKKVMVLSCLLGTLLVLGGCASGLTGDTYSRDEARAPQTVRMGTVESVRPVQIEGTKTIIGPAAGAAVGGIAGSSVGGGRGSMIAGVIGAVAGGMAGAATEEGVTRSQGVEVTVPIGWVENDSPRGRKAVSMRCVCVQFDSNCYGR